jgi:hypothetical protein
VSEQNDIAGERQRGDLFLLSLSALDWSDIDNDFIEGVEESQRVPLFKPFSENTTFLN